MGSKPQGMDRKQWLIIERNRRKEARAKKIDEKTKNGEGRKLRSGKLFIMTDEHKAKISMGVARAKAQRDARKATFANQDTEYLAKRKYKKRMPIASLQMSGMVHDLERFIANLSTMSATDYLEMREDLIISIIKRGGKLYGN